MDKFKIDGHKLLYHVPRVNAWLEGENTYPIYIETSPSGACNHRCRFCGKDFMQYQHRFLDWSVFKDRLAEMGRLGVKSMMHAGEGEPLLHEHLEDMIRHGKEAGIDQALNTNGVLLKPERAERILPHAEWIRVSVDAGTPETYSALHRTKPADFDRVLHNLAEASKMKKAHGWRCTLGVQMLLLPENRNEVTLLAEHARNAGVDYLVIKPYSQHPLSITTEFQNVSYEDDIALKREIEGLSAPGFAVVFRAWAMDKWDRAARTYSRCYAIRFWTYIDSGGLVWGCCNYLGDDRFLLGNLYEGTFQELWEGERRRNVLDWIEQEMDTCHCRVNCRMDEVNRYLWDLRNPPDHVNFI